MSDSAQLVWDLAFGEMRMERARALIALVDFHARLHQRVVRISRYGEPRVRLTPEAKALELAAYLGPRPEGAK